MPCCAHVMGLHEPVPQTPGEPPPPHVWFDAHVPQASDPPQPLPAGPQLMPCDAQVCGVHVVCPHWLGVPAPPHVSGAVHIPQLSVPPQPSPCEPQVAPSCAHVFGVQVGTSFEMHDERSNSMNSRSFSCGVSGALAAHSVGNTTLLAPAEFST